MFKRVALVAFATCSLLAGSMSAQADETLTASEIKNLFPGSFEGVVHGLVEVQITASRNGSLSGEMMGESDSGRWRIRNGRLCISWNEWTSGEYHCSNVTRVGQWLHANSGGPVRFRKL
jgi:hypothetical protein